MKQKVYDYLLTIPYGKVVTYGQIASFLGNKRLARVVGNILHQNPNPDQYPCYKVVNAKGQLSAQFAFGGMEGQRQRLEAEGIPVENGCVDLTQYGFVESIGACRSVCTAGAKAPLCKGGCQRS